MKVANGLLALIVCLAFTGFANAQQSRHYRSPRYVPPGGPVLPSGLNYFRQDTGVLDPYNAFVAPQRQLNQQLQTLYEQQEFDANQVRRLQNSRGNNVAPTGTGAVFMNYSHYYRMQPIPVRVR